MRRLAPMRDKERVMAGRAMLVNEIQVGSEFLKTGSAGTMDHVDPATGKVNCISALAGKA